MNLNENRIGMRILRLARSLAVSHFPHSQAIPDRVHNSLKRFCRSSAKSSLLSQVVGALYQKRSFSAYAIDLLGSSHFRVSRKSHRELIADSSSIHRRLFQ
jgi:hypothetical protein